MTTQTLYAKQQLWKSLNRVWKVLDHIHNWSLMLGNKNADYNHRANYRLSHSFRTDNGSERMKTSHKLVTTVPICMSVVGRWLPMASSTHDSWSLTSVQITFRVFLYTCTCTQKHEYNVMEDMKTAAVCSLITHTGGPNLLHLAMQKPE